MAPAEHSRQRAVREDHLRNHQKLLDAALELFDEHGIDVPLREIGRRAGVSQAGIFRHFTNRDQLVIELYDRSAADVSDRALQALTRTRHDPSADRLDALLSAIVDAATEHPCYGRLAVRGMSLHPDRVTDPVLVEELGHMITSAQHDGVLATDITGVDLAIAPTLVVGLLSQNSATAPLAPRMMTLLRRGLTPQAQTIAPMPTPPGSNPPERNSPTAGA